MKSGFCVFIVGWTEHTNESHVSVNDENLVPPATTLINLVVTLRSADVLLFYLQSALKIVAQPFT